MKQLSSMAIKNGDLVDERWNCKVNTVRQLSDGNEVHGTTQLCFQADAKGGFEAGADR
jgi:hypothetical protein